jgi:hypothetical protein
MTQQDIEEFNNEVRILKKLKESNNPNIVKMLDFAVV